MVAIKKLTMDEVLDSSLALSCLMNYMDSKGGTPLIHFYLTCAGFRASAEQLLEVPINQPIDTSMCDTIYSQSINQSLEFRSKYQVHCSIFSDRNIVKLELKTSWICFGLKVWRLSATISAIKPNTKSVWKTKSSWNGVGVSWPKTFPPPTRFKRCRTKSTPWSATTTTRRLSSRINTGRCCGNSICSGPWRTGRTSWPSRSRRVKPSRPVGSPPVSFLRWRHEMRPQGRTLRIIASRSRRIMRTDGARRGPCTGVIWNFTICMCRLRRNFRIWLD